MVSSRKRGRQDIEDAELPMEPPRELGLLERIRNMWEFANLAQWIFLFGKAVKIDEDIDIEELEMECLKPQSTILSDIGLALLKFVSSHRGLTPEIFDEYTRRQYIAKAPTRNPYGDEEEPSKFAEFDIFTKIRVLQQLTQWTLGNPDRIRERMDEQKDSDQLYWRIEPFGWDSKERTYFVLDDDRLYRRTDPPPPPPPAPKPKKGSKKAKAALRASKRRKASDPELSDDEGPQGSGEEQEDAVVEHDGLGGSKWECLAISLDELNNFLTSIQKSRDPDEKILRTRLAEDLLPLLEKREESRKRKQAQKERELLNLEKLALAKRSSRIAGKLEQQKQDEEAKEAERKKQADLIMAKKQQEKWMKLEKERESRMITREQRLKEREARRILHEEELANLSEDNKKLEAGESRLSERHLKAEIERKKQALEQLAQEDDWVFDCICGAYGQVDDGSHSISCENCNIWQHTKCVGIKEEDADGEDFHFICQTCKRRAAREVKEAKRRAEEVKRLAEEAERAKHHPKITLKIKRPGSSSSPAAPSPSKESSVPAPTSTVGGGWAMLSPQKSIHPQQSPPPTYASPYGNGAVLPMQHHLQLPRYPAISPSMPMSEARPASQGSATSSQWSPPANGSTQERPILSAAIQPSGHNPFSSPHPHSPTSLPPPQARNYSSVDGNPPHPSATPSQLLSPTKNETHSYQHPIVQTTPGPRLPSPYHLSSHQPNADQSQRRASMTLPSPVAGAPILTPSPSYNTDTVPLAQNFQSTPVPRQVSSMMNFSSPSGAYSQASSAASDPSHAAALPPAISGISPTKHSPPQHSTSNGFSHLGAATPSVLPPVASLAPSPQQQIMTPPIKHTEPEANRFVPPLPSAPVIAAPPAVTPACTTAP